MSENIRVRPLRADVREQVLAAAREEFGERGYAGTSVAQVAARAGFTKGAVYSNFGGKPELFAAAVQAYFTETVGDAFSGALAAAIDDPALPAARAMGRALARDVVRGSRWPSLLSEFRALAHTDPELARLYADLRRTQRRQLSDALRAAGQQVLLRPGLDLEVGATLLLTTVHGLTVEHAAAPDALPAGLVEDVFTHVLEGVLA